MLTEMAIPKPEMKRRISALEVLQGSVVSPLEKVNAMDEDSYEDFTLEWVDGYIKVKNLSTSHDRYIDNLPSNILFKTSLNS